MKIIKGNLIDLAEQGQFDVIVHGCNCFNTMGSGIAAQIRARYPESYTEDCKTLRGSTDKLGNYTHVLVRNKVGGSFTIINAYTQYDYRGPKNLLLFDYEAFEKVLKLLLNDYPQASFGFPMIGCGLAHGDSEIVLNMLKKFATKLESNGGSVTVVLYDDGVVEKPSVKSTKSTKSVVDVDLKVDVPVEEPSVKSTKSTKSVVDVDLKVDVPVEEVVVEISLDTSTEV